MTITLIVICAILYAIKGGQHVALRRHWAKLLGVQLDENNNAVDASPLKYFFYEITDGTLFSSLLFGAVAVLCLPAPSGIVLFLFAGIGWWLCVAPSMGEEAGGTGGIDGNWGPYVDLKGKKSFSYSWKKGLQRGLFGAATIAIGLDLAGIPINYIPLLLAGASWPLAYFIGISIEQVRKDIVNAPWHWAEWIHGATLGLGLGLSLITA